MYNKDGKRHYYKNYLFPDFEANKLKSVTSIIPEVKSKDDIRKDNNKITNYYLQLFNNFPDALVLLNIDEKIINANKSFCKLFGYDKKELKKKKLDNLIVPVGFEGDAQALTHMALTGEKIDRNVVRINSNGEKLKLKLKAFPVLLHDNRIGVYAIYREIDKH
jgi:PAS domain S-box-containing protein